MTSRERFPELVCGAKILALNAPKELRKMSTVEEIVKAVKDLPPQEQAEVKRRLEGLFTQSDQSYVSAKTLQADDLDQRQKSGRLEALFGSVSLGHPAGVDNESIDRDLAREYAATHE